jgi:phosphoribosylformylglycinamidine synthase PurS subunit
MKIRILIRKKEGVLDIEGKAVKNALTGLGIKGFNEVAKGMFLEIEFTGSEADVPSFVQEACEKLLVNDVIETFEYEILK